VSNPKVSIIVRTTGQRNTSLVRALDSIWAQTEKSFQIVVVEDGSERARATLEAWCVGREDTVTYLSIPKGGRSKAGNEGIAKAQGTFIGFLDDDDALFPDHLSTLLPLLSAPPEAPAAYARAYENITVWGGLGSRRRPAGFHPYNRVRLWLSNHIPIQAVLARRAVVVACGGLDESLDSLEDWDLWLRLSFAGVFVSSDRITSEFNVRGGRRAERQRFAEHGRALDAIRRKYETKTLSVPFAEVGALPPDLLAQTKNLYPRRCPVMRCLHWLVGG